MLKGGTLNTWVWIRIRIRNTDPHSHLLSYSTESEPAAMPKISVPDP
jgi:hypothetical protein